MAACGREFEKVLKPTSWLGSNKKVRVKCGRPKRHDGACAPGPNDDDLRKGSGIFGGW